MSQQIRLSKKAEFLTKDILNEMTKRHYSRVSFCGMLDHYTKKDYTIRQFAEAVTFLKFGKLIDVLMDNKIKTNTTLILLNETGHEIKNTQISGYKDDKYGIISYHPNSIFKNEIHCSQHLEQQVKQTKSIIDPKCKKCFDARAQCICILHNQSLEFCAECKALSELHKIIAGNNKDFGEVEDQYISKLLNEHTLEYWAN